VNVIALMFQVSAYRPSSFKHFVLTDQHHEI